MNRNKTKKWFEDEFPEDAEPGDRFDVDDHLICVSEAPDKIKCGGSLPPGVGGSAPAYTLVTRGDVELERKTEGKYKTGRNYYAVPSGEGYVLRMTHGTMTSRGSAIIYKVGG